MCPHPLPVRAAEGPEIFIMELVSVIKKTREIKILRMYVLFISYKFSKIERKS